MKRDVKSALKEVWKDEFMVRENGMSCALCGDYGVIDTRATAITSYGTSIGKLFYCICDMGRYKKKLDIHGLEEHYHPLARVGSKK